MKSLIQLLFCPCCYKKRRRLVLWLTIAVAIYFAASVGKAHGQTSDCRDCLPIAASRQKIERVESVGFTVADMDKEIDFFTRVLTFEKISDAEVLGSDVERLQGIFGARMRVVRMKLGDEVLELTQYLTPAGRLIPVDSRSNDRWFQHIAIIVSDMNEAYKQLRANKVQHASTAPQTLPAWNKNAAGIKAFYFKDPENHVFEILQFPPDKGALKWHQLDKSGKTFLGIDHTAIAVGSTSASLSYYRDILGLKVVGESVNYGTEQEHLNNVFGARLQITTLRPEQGGVAVELLEYLSPRDGKPYPADSKANDLWHWQTSFEASSAAYFAKVFRAAKFNFVSSDLISFENNQLGFRRAFLVRDPDGHAARIIER